MLNKKAKEEKKKLEVKDEKGNKLCPIHRKAYLLVPETHPSYTGFCCHPDCVGKQITAMCERRRDWKHKLLLMHHLQIWEDFISFITEELLTEAQKAHKPTIINQFWFRFKLLKFLHRDLRKGYAVLSKVPSHYRASHQQIKFMDEWEQDVIDNEYEKFKEHKLFSFPESLTFRAEVNEFVEERYGKEWVLFLNGEINRYDLARLYHLSMPKIRRIEKGVYRLLVDEFCDKERREEIYNSLGLDGETPLKDIIVHPLKDLYGRGKGRMTKMDRTYYETLAKKINESKGYTSRDRTKFKKIALKEKELAELKASIRGSENVECEETETSE